MKKINIALCGVGNVGSSFIDLLFTSREKIKSNFEVFNVPFKLDISKNVLNGNKNIKWITANAENLPIPEMVPPVPTPTIKWVTLPLV